MNVLASAAIGCFLGFVFGVGCALAVMYSIYMGGYRAAVKDSQVQPQPERFKRLVAKLTVSGLLVALAVASVNGQSEPVRLPAAMDAAKAYAYDVVSIRQSSANSNSARYENLPGGFSMENLTLVPLIPDAYGMIRNDQVTGWPGWALSTRFDIEAKMDEATARSLEQLPKQQREMQRRLMLQSLLADRFSLKVHHSTEVRTTYELVLAKGGPKMKEDNPDGDLNGDKLQEGVRPATDWLISDGKISGHAMPISLLADHLQGAVDAVVADKTGLTRRYDVVLHWDKTDGRNPDSTEPLIFTAVQEQLGLALKPTKTTVETIVIDHLEMPSEN